MRTLPSDTRLDSSLALLHEGYRFGINRYRALGSNIFQTRLLLQRTICMRGEDAARLFYDEQRFARRGAMPRAIKKTLLGMGGVQGLDDAEHKKRKAMFMALMSPGRTQALQALVQAQWRLCIGRWQDAGRVVLLDELEELLCRSVCAWTGVPLADAEAPARAADLAILFDGAGGVGVRHVRSRMARRRTEAWITGLIRSVRDGRLTVPADSALGVVAAQTDIRERLLTPHVAAVELINVLRPTVAISRFMVFAAMALHAHPQWRDRLDDDRQLLWFVQEVRRYYPFFPMTAARVRRDFEWNGYRFPKGRRVMLDLYGTNHCPDTWHRPEAFDPERFARWDGSAFNFIPQGGGEHYAHHRCPGEDPTIALICLALRMLTREMSYIVPEQDLQLDLSRMPALPRSRFIIESVRPHNG